MNGDDPPTQCYNRPTLQQRIAATSASRHAPKATDIENHTDATFPAPLVLPGDDLALDPRYPPQSLSSWKQETYRNEVTPERNTIYVVAPPTVSSKAAAIHTWTSPRGNIDEGPTQKPKVDDIVAYLEAFYHGLSVKPFLSTKLSFTTWEADNICWMERLGADAPANHEPSVTPFTFSAARYGLGEVFEMG